MLSLKVDILSHLRHQNDAKDGGRRGWGSEGCGFKPRPEIYAIFDPIDSQKSSTMIPSQIKVSL